MTDVRVFGHIDHRCGKRGYWYGSQLAIATKLSLSDRAVRESVAKLRSWGFIETTRQGAHRKTVLLYTIVPVAADAPSEVQEQHEDDREEATGTTVPVTDRNSGAGRSDGPEPLFLSHRNGGSAADPSPALSPAPEEPDQIPPPPRALRLLDIDELASIERLGEPPPTREGLDAVFEDLRSLTAELCGWLAPSTAVCEQLLAWGRDGVTRDDIARIRTECLGVVEMDGGGRRGNRWNLIRSIAGRVAVERKVGRDPWAEPALRLRANERRRPANAMRPDPAHAELAAGVVVVGAMPDGRPIRKRDVARGHLEDGTPIPAEVPT